MLILPRRRVDLNSNIFILPPKPAKFHSLKKTKKGSFYLPILKISFFWPKTILKISENEQIEAVRYKLLNVLYDQWVRGYWQEFEFEAH